MNLLNFTIVKFTLCLIVGIIISLLISVSTQLIFAACIGLILLLAVLLFISKNQIQKTVWFGLIAYLAMICIGMLTFNVHDQRQFKTHYSKIISVENHVPELITFRIREVLKPTTYHDKYVVNVLKIGNKQASGKLLLNVEKDSTSKHLDVDGVLIASTSLSKLNLPLNPYQFNYNGYLKKQHIDFQLFLKNDELLQISSKPHTLYGHAAAIRTKIDKKLKAYNFKRDELAIIDALLLGQRKDISQETYNNYINAGAVHILAVSGLHIGIILLILNWVFKPIERLKHGNYIKMSLIAISLWCFAIIAGLSPSVTRAVAMFTVFAIGMNLKRPANIYNTLAISMFMLLLFKPRFLYDLGFQMSYLAVISIVSIQPLLKNLWYPSTRVVRYFWDIFTVTLAAQIGVVPISLYYFHQFPGLFFISNLIVIPLLTLNLCFGILIIFMALLNLLPEWLADTFGFSISSMNNFIAWVSHQERFVFRDISFGILFVIASYLLIVSVFSYVKKPNYRRLAIALISVLLLQGTLVFEKFRGQSSEFVIFHKNRFTMIGVKQNERLTVADNLDNLTKKRDNIIRNYKVGNSITSIKGSKLKSVYDFKNEKLLIVDSLGVYNVKSFKPDYILLRNSPKVNVNRLIDSLRPKLIIADGSNYKSYVERWKTTSKQQKIPFHQTSEKGAFILKY